MPVPQNIASTKHKPMVTAFAAEPPTRWVGPEIQALTAYHVPASTGMVKLDAMENPYPWPDDLRDPWLQSLRNAELNRYPDPEAKELKEKLRELLGLPPEAGLLLGNGSDELIQMILLTVASPGRCVLAPEPTFAMYKIISQCVGLRFVGVPLLISDFALDIETMLEAIACHQPAAVFLAYPNNPTANLFARSHLERILRASPGVVIIDEAYHEFSKATFLPDLPTYPNLLILRTLSKCGLAGLRVGALVGRLDWIREINKVRLPYNLNTLSQASALFMLGRARVLEEQIARICADRERLAESLGALPQIKFWPSKTNFLTLENKRCDDLADRLKQKGILIKDLTGVHPLVEGCIRVTVGTPEENNIFLQALASVG
ncbi:MAG: histidinol-phosphate transaminase [Gammaproteobacteria bacterium]